MPHSHCTAPPPPSPSYSSSQTRSRTHRRSCGPGGRRHYVLHENAREEPLYYPFCALTPLLFPGYLVLSRREPQPKNVAFYLRFPFKFGADAFPLATSQYSTLVTFSQMNFKARLSSSLGRTPVPILCCPSFRNLLSASHLTLEPFLTQCLFLSFPMRWNVGGVQVRSPNRICQLRRERLHLASVPISRAHASHFH